MEGSIKAVLDLANLLPEAFLLYRHVQAALVHKLLRIALDVAFRGLLYFLANIPGSLPLFYRPPSTPEDVSSLPNEIGV